MKPNPLTLVLLTGSALLLLSGVGAYQWADREAVTAPSSTEVADRNDPASPSTPAETTDSGGTLPADTVTLTAGDWSTWIDYQGERRRMLGVERRHSGVNFRAGPGSDYPIVRTIPGGTLLFPRDRLNDWFRARLRDGTVGWIHRTLVRELNVPRPVVSSLREELPPLSVSVKRAIPADFRTHNRLVVAESRLNLRQGPGTQFGIVGHAYRYEELRLMARRGNWYRVQTVHGENGWVYRNLVKPVWIRSPGNRQRVRFSDAGLRIGPREQFQAPESFSPSDPVPVLERQDGWLLVQVRKDRIGWLHESEVITGNPPRTESPADQSRRSDQRPREATRGETQTGTTTPPASP